MNQTITINVGLNNNPYTFESVVTLTTRIFKRVNKIEAQLREGLYHPDEQTIVFEPTAVIRLSVYTERPIETTMEHLCELFTQECIPYRLIENKQGVLTITEELVYNKSFEGERYAFDAKYFLDIEETN